jgi:hypothetical protein
VTPATLDKPKITYDFHLLPSGKSYHRDRTNYYLNCI